jgi:hypothetical protein
MWEKCPVCIEGQKKEDDFRCRQIAKRVFYSFQNEEEEEEEEQEKEERNLFICDRCHSRVVQGAVELTKKRDAGKTEFVGSLFFKDGSLDTHKYNEARDQFSKEREIQTGGYLVEIPQDLSAEDCKNPYIREFYTRHPLASNITIRPGESHEQALARQNPNQKDGQTIQLLQKLKGAIYGEHWDTARKIFNKILDVDPLQRRPPPPTQEKGEPEPKRSRRDEAPGPSNPQTEE